MSTLICSFSCRPHLRYVRCRKYSLKSDLCYQIDEQRRALDTNGLRYLTSMRSFYILNSRSESSSAHNTSTNGEVGSKPGRRERLRYRDMVWAFHSESQEILLQASVAACEGKMNLMDAKALGVFLWLKSLDSVVRLS
jgi:hypothetical protein